MSPTVPTSTADDVPVPAPETAPRALFVHAHPDDETITTGGTVATLVASGWAVRVVTCTLGEQGEVLQDELQGLTADQADQLGGYRIAELAGALTALGVEAPRFLGGVGRWRDSGMAGEPSARHPRAFVASGAPAVEALAGELDEFRPDLVVTYDHDGGYGHPDHIRAHEVTVAALEAADHTPARVAWTVTAASALLAGPASVDPAAVADGLRPARPGELPSVPDSRLTHRVALDESAHAAKLQALAEHATQLRVEPAGDGEEWFFALTNGVLQPIPREEWYIASEPSDGGWARLPVGGADLRDGLLP